jgi:hypothetical protein
MTTIKASTVRQPTGRTSSDPVRSTPDVAPLSNAQPDRSTTTRSATARSETRRPEPRIEFALQQWRLKGGHTVPAAMRRETALLMQAVHLGLVSDVEDLPDALFTDRANVLVLAAHFGSSALERVANGFTDMKLVERALAKDPALALNAAVLKWRAPTDADIERALQSRSDLADQVPAAARARKSVAVAVVTADPSLFSSLPSRTREDPAVVAAAVRGDPALFDGTDVAAFRSHAQVVEALLVAAPSRWTDVDAVLLARPEIARAACADAAFLRALPQGLAGDRAFILSVAEVPGVLAAAAPTLRADIEIVRTAVGSDPASFAHAAPALRSNRAFLLELARGTPTAIAHAGRDILDDDAFMRSIIASAPRCLSWASAAVRDDTAVVRAAVARGADFDASPRLCADPETVLIAMRAAVVWTVPVDQTLLKDPAFALRAVAHAGARSLCDFTDDVLSDPAVVAVALADVSDVRQLDPRITLDDADRLSLLTRYGWNAKSLDKVRPLTKAEAMAAVANTGGVFPHLPNPLKTDVDVALEAVVSMPQNLELLNKAMLNDAFIEKVFARSPFALDAVPDARDRFLKTRPALAAEHAALQARCTRLGIEWPERFRSPKALLEVLDIRENAAGPDARPAAVIIAPKIDANSAFLANGNFDRLTQAYRLFYFEAETDEDALLALRSVPGESSAAVILAGHGTQEFLSFGASDPARGKPDPGNERLFFDFTDADIVAELGQRVAPGGRVILHSCSTGKGEAAEDNLANLIAQGVPHATVQAPTRPTNGRYTVDGQGVLTGPGFFGGVAETYTVAAR